MNRSDRFIGFLESLKNEKNSALIESIKEGFVLIEGEMPVGNEWFDSYGNVLKEIPKEAVEEIAVGGRDAQPWVDKWIDELDFTVPADKARKYLGEFGAWSDEELASMSDRELAEKVLWIAAGDISGQGEWFGMV